MVTGAFKHTLRHLAATAYALASVGMSGYAHEMLMVSRTTAIVLYVVVANVIMYGLGKNWDEGDMDGVVTWLIVFVTASFAGDLMGERYGAMLAETDPSLVLPAGRTLTSPLDEILFGSLIAVLAYLKWMWWREDRRADA